ncbi:MAG: lipoyl domain-containing protein [Rhodospirillales bacterium]|nr:lipoyl domain-containing protein [Rhodospirillales bacterium]
MKVTLKLTRVGMTMEEATIVRWAKRPGDTFAKGEVLYEIETEKVTQEVEAPGTGTLVEILAPEGSDIAVGDNVCVVDTDSPH